MFETGTLVALAGMLAVLQAVGFSAKKLARLPVNVRIRTKN